MNEQLFEWKQYRRSEPILSKEERTKEQELRNPKTILEFVVNQENGVLTENIWAKNVIDPSETVYQLLRDERTGQLAIIKWKKGDIVKPHPTEGFKREYAESHYRTSYGHAGQFEEVGLYGSRTALQKSIQEVRAIGATYQPLAELQKAIDEGIRKQDAEDQEMLAGHSKSEEDGDDGHDSMLARAA
ncbi:MAG: hypothetical protein UU48_C0006G0121 [Candidatus Uhrbacteria bacterium GW2011_GWF2_41_16]|uniref:Uncharacterized protein n=2 Tax=Candidatus Uhriibacteriota TaxID=1752732 RepID=A0A0G0VEG7_9BACT|nr:MAG: hypothetical protein UU35_C0007G0011 [Candidatus Uhrbacteria bacterium GW2011_GWC2_41_11]KKR98081.1 MAG: hypothetical protein UU48_C0006G0121 [Candidatus Uhrbacteria bacterium GW2011_GWF2_41_16]HBO99653.1 hypothetical protein [Candidatus Uhrbacteria bacterium]